MPQPLLVIEKYLSRALIAIVGASIAVNSFLLTDKIEQINVNISEMTKSIHSLEVNSAVAISRIDNTDFRMGELSGQIDKIWREIRYLHRKHNKETPEQ